MGNASASASMAEALSALSESPFRDASCCGLSIAGALVLVKSFDLMATGNIIDQVDDSKWHA